MNVNRAMNTPEQQQAPYADALRAKAQRDVLDLMVPGHGQNSEGLSQDLAEYFGEAALRMDVPMLIDGIDVGADSPFAEATRLAAAAWSAERSWFLANGASQANRMALLAIASANIGDTVLTQRSAHSSVTDGFIVSGLRPRFVLPSIDTERGIHHGVTAALIESELQRARAEGVGVAAVHVTSPSYFGAVADVRGIAEAAHRHGVPLIVDGAWGAHFGFHEDLPESPTRLGANVVVSSTHKLGGSLSQSAMLHLASGRCVEERSAEGRTAEERATERNSAEKTFTTGLSTAALAELLDRAFHLTQTTSASALLLGSLDVARRALVQGHAAIGRSIEQVEACRARLRADGRFTIVSDHFADFSDIVAHDPLRISIDVSATGRSGLELRKLLLKEFDITVELATVRAIAAFVGPGKLPDLDRLLRALFTLADRADRSISTAPLPSLPVPGQAVLSPRAAFFARHETVAAARAIGRVSADTLAAYPPGIPNLVPGEVITRETVEFLHAIASSPYGYVRGAQDAAVSTLRVLAEPLPRTHDAAS